VTRPCICYSGNCICFLCRRHPTPTKEMLEPLLRVSAAIGLNLDVSSSKALADSLDHAVVYVLFVIFCILHVLIILVFCRQYIIYSSCIIIFCNKCYDFGQKNFDVLFMAHIASSVFFDDIIWSQLMWSTFSG